MTPQLQQAIRLLQLSTLDLQQEIQQIVESNPMLEQTEENEADEALSAETDNDNSPTQTVDDHGDEHQHDHNAEDNTATENARDSDLLADEAAPIDSEPLDDTWQKGLPDELPVDSQWDDIYPNSTPTSSQRDSGFNELPQLENHRQDNESLSEHLLWQLNLTPMSDKDRLIATTLIDALLPSGLLGSSIEELHDNFSVELEIELDEIEAVRHRIQQFDPVGVASRDLVDCLMTQLAQLPSDTPWREQAAQIIHRHLPLLANRDFTQLMRRTRLKEPQLAEVIGLIRSLNPQPGEAYQRNAAQYIVPDVFVEKQRDRWVVRLNSDTAPKLRINNHYAALIKRADNSADNTFLRDNLQEAKWFLKSLRSRNETLLKVASKIVERQCGFLERGEEAMEPLVLHDIAESIEMHESTISRVTTQKYMHTPRGIFELKYFFSSHVATATGGECSSTAIRAIIKRLVAAEEAKKPLSDNKIANLLDQQGIKVARRTIAKYRESMSIPPSNERKRIN